MRKTGFYFKLALTGIAKNRRLYIPFMLASVGVAAMFYIVACLEDSPVIIGAKGGGAHASVEWIELRCLDEYADLLEQFLGE